MSSDVHAGPLPKASPTDEHHAGPLIPATAATTVKRTEREKRWERRRRRRFAEEVVGWIVVPIVLVAGFWTIKATLSAFGTTPTALIDGIKAITSGRS